MPRMAGRSRLSARKPLRRQDAARVPHTLTPAARPAPHAPGRPLLPIEALQATAGNRAVARLVDSNGVILRKEVTIEGELVEVHSRLGKITKRGEQEKKEAEAIIKEIKDKFGVTVSSSKLIEGIKEQYTNVPKKVTKALKARKWRLNELKALCTALKNYAPILGANRGGSTRSGSDQEVIYVGKGAQAIDTNKKAGKLDTTTLGEYFKGKKTMGLFKASEGFHDVFKDEQQELVGTFIHEIAHGLLAYAYDDFVAQSGGFWTDQDTKSGAKDAEKPPTDYGNKNAREDMCDTASLFFIEPSRLDKFPKRKAFMEKLGKDWAPTLKEAPPELGGVPKDGDVPKAPPIPVGNPG